MSTMQSEESSHQTADNLATCQDGVKAKVRTHVLLLYLLALVSVVYIIISAVNIHQRNNELRARIKILRRKHVKEKKEVEALEKSIEEVRTKLKALKNDPAEISSGKSPDTQTESTITELPSTKQDTTKVPDICGQSQPCLNGGTCHELTKTSFRCECPLGWKGHICQTGGQLKGRVQFEGKNSYLKFEETFLNHTASPGQAEKNVIEFRMKTKQTHGLIWWQGVKGGKGDYFSISVNQTYLEVRWDLGSGVGRVRSDDNVNKGLYPHDIYIVRSGKFVTWKYEGHDQKGGSSRGKEDTLDVQDNSIYIGGVPDLANFTGSLFSSNFIGCIYDLSVQGQSNVDFGSLALNNQVTGSNVVPCK